MTHTATTIIGWTTSMAKVNRFAVYWYAADTYGGYIAIKDRETDIWIER